MSFVGKNKCTYVEILLLSAISCEERLNFEFEFGFEFELKGGGISEYTLMGVGISEYTYRGWYK